MRKPLSATTLPMGSRLASGRHASMWNAYWVYKQNRIRRKPDPISFYVVDVVNTVAELFEDLYYEPVAA
jgi:hypothetical protein